MEKIEKIALSVMKLTDEDFNEAAETIEQQKSYYNPLRLGTVAWQRALAEHNEKVVNAIKELKSIIESGKDITPEKYGSDFKTD